MIDTNTDRAAKLAEKVWPRFVAVTELAMENEALEVDNLRTANIAYAEQVAKLIGRAGNAELEAAHLRALIVPGLRVYKGDHVVQIDTAKHGQFTERFSDDDDVARALAVAIARAAAANAGGVGMSAAPARDHCGRLPIGVSVTSHDRGEFAYTLMDGLSWLASIQFNADIPAERQSQVLKTIVSAVNLAGKQGDVMTELIEAAAEGLALLNDLDPRHGITTQLRAALANAGGAA